MMGGDFTTTTNFYVDHLGSFVHLILIVSWFYLVYRLTKYIKIQNVINFKLMGRVLDLELKMNEILRVQVIDIETRLDRLERRRK